MADITKAEALRRLMIEVCPFRVGHRVRIRRDDWPGIFIIVGLQWDYRAGKGHGINVTVASEEDIINRRRSADGFGLDEIEPAT